KTGISAGAAGGDHDGRQTTAVELRGMVETRLVYRRRPAIIFGGPEDYDRIRRTQHILAGPGNDITIEYGNIEQDCQQQPQRPFFEKSRRHQSRNSASSVSGIAPWRRMVVLSPLISMMVDATSRGLVPPSTIRVRRPPSCWRTPSAVVHSLAP